VIETGVIRLVRKRQEEQADAAEVDLITDVVRDVLPAVLQEREVQDAIAAACHAAQLREARRQHPSARGGVRRG
jgi:hypothetical protein